MKQKTILKCPPPIVCATQIDDRYLLCRSDGTIEISGSSLSHQFPFQLISVMYISEISKIIGIDKNGSVHFIQCDDPFMVTETIHPDPTIRPILRQSDPGTGISEIDYNGNIQRLGDCLYFRFDREIVRMSLDTQSRKRWFSPLMRIPNSFQEQKTSVAVQFRSDKLIAGITASSSLLYIASFPSDTPQTMVEMSMEIVALVNGSTMKIVDSIEIPNMMVENFSLLTSSNNFLFIQTVDGSVRVVHTDPGLRFHSIVTIPSGPSSLSHPPPSVKRLNSLPPLPVPDISTTNVPRYNPQLNVLRKHSQPMPYSSISDTILNLSLPHHLTIASNSDQQNNGLFYHPRDMYGKKLLKSLIAGKRLLTCNRDDKSVFCLTLDTPPFSYLAALPESTPDWVVEWSREGLEPIWGIWEGSGQNSVIVMTSNSLKFLFQESVQSTIDLVIELVGVSVPFSRLTMDTDLGLESIWENRSLAIVPGSHSVVSFDGEDGEDMSPRAKQRICGFSVVDAGVSFKSPLPQQTDDTMTCIFQLRNGTKLFGSFDGEIALMGINNHMVAQLPVSQKFAIESIVGDLSGDRILVGDRGGCLYTIMIDEKGEEKLWLLDRRKMGSMPVRLEKLNSYVIVHCGEKIFVAKTFGELLVRQVHIGYTRPLRSVVSMESDNKIELFALTDDGKHVFRIQIDSRSECSEYAVRLPCDQASSVAVVENRLYVLGSIPRLNQRALLELELNPDLVGALDSPDTLSLSSILPFDSLKEEPMFVCEWRHSEFPEGLVVVGTHGKSRGRIIVFDRTDMTPICKTSVPSRQVAIIEAMSPSMLAIGCTDCVVFVGLTTGEDNTLVLVTLGVFQTYNLVRHVSRVSDNRCLIVLSNGMVSMLELKGDTVIHVGGLDSQRHIISRCVVVGNEKILCSSIEGDLLEFSIAHVDSTGTMRISSTAHVGTSIGYSSQGTQGTLVSMTSGSIFQVSN